MKTPRESTFLEYRRRIRRVMSHISENLERDLALEEIAGVSCFSTLHVHLRHLHPVEARLTGGRAPAPAGPGPQERGGGA